MENLKKRGFLMDSITCVISAYYGYFDILKWLLQNECEWDDSIFEAAAYYGNTEVLDWLLRWTRKNNNPYSKNLVPSVAVKPKNVKNTIELLEWCEKSSCSLNCAISIVATKNGNFEALKWLEKTQDGRWIAERSICNIAASGGYMNILEWVKTKGLNIDNIINIAASDGQLEVIEWILKNRIPNNPLISIVCENAIVNGHLKIFKMLLKNGCEYNLSRCRSLALMYDMTDIVLWIECNLF